MNPETKVLLVAIVILALVLGIVLAALLSRINALDEQPERAQKVKPAPGAQTFSIRQFPEQP